MPRFPPQRGTQRNGSHFSSLLGPEFGCPQPSSAPQTSSPRCFGELAGTHLSRTQGEGTELSYGATRVFSDE